MMVLMHAEAEKGGDTENGRQKPALQQKTTDAYVGSQNVLPMGVS